MSKRNKGRRGKRARLASIKARTRENLKLLKLHALMCGGTLKVLPWETEGWIMTELLEDRDVRVALYKPPGRDADIVNITSKMASGQWEQLRNALSPEETPKITSHRTQNASWQTF